jgi:hypothetical protein
LGDAMTTRNGFAAPSFHATLVHSTRLVGGLVLGLMVGLLAAAPAAAADWSYKAPAAPSTYTSDFGMRFWYGSGKRQDAVRRHRCSHRVAAQL